MFSTDDLNELDDELAVPAKQRQRRQDRRALSHLHRPKKTENELRADLGLAPTTVETTATGFNPTYSGKKHERLWILSGLGEFYDHHLITDVLCPVKAGKEASVYCCAAGPSQGVPWLAGKVYRPRMFRQLRNDKVYREGRIILDAEGKLVKDEGAAHAIATGTAFGKDLLHTSWLSHEYETLEKLHAAGALVPKPVARGPNAILMEYMGEAETPAPTLNHVSLDKDEAQELFDQLVRSVEIMLANNLVHGDLSAFNVLYWEGEVRIIDFPQAVNVERNQHAHRIFERDIERLCSYFQRQGVNTNARKLARDLWRAHISQPTHAEKEVEDRLMHLDPAEGMV